jgi:hypothetical protein
MYARNSNHICRAARGHVRVDIAVSTSPEIRVRVLRVAGWRTRWQMLASALPHIGHAVAYAGCHRASTNIDTRAGSQAESAIAHPACVKIGMPARARTRTRHGQDIWHGMVYHALRPLWEQV